MLREKEEMQGPMETSEWEERGLGDGEGDRQWEGTFFFYLIL